MDLKVAAAVFYNLQTMTENEKVRIDKYLWAIRIFKTRSQATAACDDGKVKFEGKPVKPSRIVHVGDRFDIKSPTRKWTIEIVGVIQNRVNYDEAIKNYVDLTSEEDRQPAPFVRSSFFTGKRQSKTGRPTKKQRRDLSDLLGPDNAQD